MVLATLALWLFAVPAFAGNPDQRWRTIETEHFFVHYFAGEEEIAERVALVAERAYTRLSNNWGHPVFLKTHIVLTDEQDAANGLATAVPYPRIIAFATAPEALSVLEAYDDWVDILITHELTHVIHLDTVHGVSRLINAVLGFGVLGKVTAPNILQPRWIVEGVATMEESALSSQGRRRSAQFDAYIRMAVVEDAFLTIDQVTSGARVWPHGTSVYLYGVHFMHYIAARYGMDKLRELSHVYARQLLPFGINKAMRTVLGVSFYQLWREFEADTTRRFEAQERRIRSRGLRQGRRLTFEGETTRYPFWSPDGSFVYFYKEAGHQEEGVKRIRASGGRIRQGRGIGRQGMDVDIEHVVDVENTGAASFLPGTDEMVFDMVSRYDYRYAWSDLYRWRGGDTKRFERLTSGLRASEPHVSPDGRHVVFRRNDIGQSRLGFYDMRTGKTVDVPPLGKISQVYTPRFSPDGRRVAFSGWREGGYRDIYIYDRGTGATERITADRHMDMSPSWTPDGRYIVFSSDRDDVYNLYAYDLEARKLRQVSNVLGGAFEPRVSPDGKRIAYVGYSTVGYDLWVMEFDPAKFLDVMPSVDDLPPAANPKPPLPTGDVRPLALKSTRYRPIKTFFPRTIFPSALDFAAGEFGTGIGFSTALSDVLGFHSLSFGFNYLIAAKAANWTAAYSFTRLFPDFSLRFSRSIGFPARSFTRYDYEGDGDAYLVTGYRERRTNVGLSMSLPILRHPRHSASAAVGYSWTRWRNLDENDIAVDPNAPASQLPEVGDAAAVDIGLSYSSLGDGAGRFTTGAERGRRLGVSFSILDERLGGDFNDLQLTASYREALAMPWRGHQVLELGLTAGASTGGLARRGAFCVGEFSFGGDILQSVLARVGTGAGGCYLLRGYPGFGNPQGKGVLFGRHFTVASLDYKIPLIDVDRGLGTLPFFLQRILLIPFVDVGNTWSGEFRWRQLLTGTGAQLVFALRLGYGEPINLLLHYAHGFDEDKGIDTFRAVLSTSF